VVSTSIGAEGLPVQDGENILLADTPNDFSQAVLSLLQDAGRRKRLGAAARTLVQENFSWLKVADIFARTLQDAVTSSRPRRT
jgi:glycosyltransferase involved in cell wall biosynthesis